METACPLCDKRMSWCGLSKHIFSATHSVDLPKLILEANCTSELRVTSRMPIVRNKNEDKNDLRLCFGCKKCWLTPKPGHLSECPHADKHKRMMEAVLKSKETGEPVSTILLKDAQAKIGENAGEIERLRAAVQETERLAAAHKAAKLENEKQAKEIERLKAALEKAKEDEAWEIKQRKEAEARIEELEENSGLDELKAKLRSKDSLLDRLLGDMSDVEQAELNERLRVAGYRGSNPLFDVEKALAPKPAAPAAPAAPQPPAAPVHAPAGQNAIVTSNPPPPTAYHQEALGQFSGINLLGNTTKRKPKQCPV